MAGLMRSYEASLSRPLLPPPPTPARDASFDTFYLGGGSCSLCELTLRLRHLEAEEQNGASEHGGFYRL